MKEERGERTMEKKRRSRRKNELDNLVVIVRVFTAFLSIIFFFFPFIILQSTLKKEPAGIKKSKKRIVLQTGGVIRSC